MVQITVIHVHVHRIVLMMCSIKCALKVGVAYDVIPASHDLIYLGEHKLTHMEFNEACDGCYHGIR